MTMARSRQDIIDEAVRLFSRYGYAGTTVRAIARAVGLLPGSLYAHIADKESVLAEIVETGIDRFLADVEAIAAAPDPADVRLTRAIRRHIVIIGENVDYTSVVFHEWKYLGPERRRAVVPKRDRYEHAFRRIVEDGIASGVFSQDLNVRLTVLFLLGCLNWIPEWYSPDGPGDADALGERIAEVLLKGVVAAPAP
jgi:AcrR family transcriptional regulator